MHLSPQLNTIGHKIRELRQQKGLTQSELANLVGCAQNTIAEWEKRKGRSPGKKFLAKIAEIFEISIDQLLGSTSVQATKIPCYGEFKSLSFNWIGTPEYFIEIPPSEFRSGLFCIKILDNLLEPVVFKNDFAIFEEKEPNDGDIAVVCFPELNNKTLIRRWRQKESFVMLSEINLDELHVPEFFQILSKKLKMCYITKNNETKNIEVKGRLYMVKKGIRVEKSYLGTKYIYS